MEVLSERLFSSDFGGPLTRPSGIVRMAAVESMVNHHLPFGEELDVRAAHAEVLNLLVREQILLGHDVEGLAHPSDIGRTAGRP